MLFDHLTSRSIFLLRCFPFHVTINGVVLPALHHLNIKT